MRDWGAFECVERIASGGGGEVWLARRLGERDCTLALKHARLGDRDAQIALRREWRGLLDVPSAALPVPVAWLEPAGKWPAAMVMDLRRGRPLTASLPGVDAQTLIGVVERCLHALMSLHAADLVHGDLHPDNVLLEEGGEVSLLDLGLAQPPGRAPAWGPGHPAFAAPERLRGEGVDPRDDLFSLAAAVWCSLGLAHPFEDYPAVLPEAGRIPTVPQGAPHPELLRVLAGWLHPERRLRPAHAEAALREWCGLSGRADYSIDAELRALVGRPWRWGRWSGVQRPRFPDARRQLWITGPRGAGRTGALRRLADDHPGPVAWLQPSHRDGLDPLRWVWAEVRRLRGEGAAAEELRQEELEESSQPRAIGELGGRAQARLDRELAALRQALGDDGLLLVDDLDDLPSALQRALRRAADLPSALGGARMALVAEQAQASAGAALMELAPVSSDEVAAAAQTADGGRGYDLAVCRIVAEVVGRERAKVLSCLAALHQGGALLRRADRVDLEVKPESLRRLALEAVSARASWALPEGELLEALAHLAVAGRCHPGVDGDPMPSLSARAWAEVEVVRTQGGALEPVDSGAQAWMLKNLPPALLARAATLRAEWLRDKAPTQALLLTLRALSWGEGTLPPAEQVCQSCEALLIKGEAEQALGLADGWLVSGDRGGVEGTGVWLQAVRALSALGRFGELDERISAAPSARLVRADVAVALADSAFKRGDYPGCHRYADEALEALGLLRQVSEAVERGADGQGAPDKNSTEPWPRDGVHALLLRAFSSTWQGELASAAGEVSLGQVVSESQPELRAQFEYLYGLACYYGGDLQEASAVFQRLDRSEDVALRAAAAAGRGLVHHRGGALDEARESYDESRRLAEQAGDRARVLNMTMNIAVLDHEAGDLGRSLSGYDRVIDGARRLGNGGALVRSSNNRGNLLALLGVWDQAEVDLREALALLEEVGNLYLEGNVCCVLAELARKTGRLREARELVVRAEGALIEAGAESELNEIRLESAWLRLTEGEVEEARAVAEEALAAANALESEHLQARARHVIACCDLASLSADPAIARSSPKLSGILRSLEESVAQLPVSKALLSIEMQADLATALGIAGRWSEASQLASEQFTRLDRFAATLRASEAVVFRHGPAYAPLRSSLRLISAAGELGMARGQSGGQGIQAGAAMNAVLALSRRLTEEHDYAALLEVLMDAAVALTGAERGFLLLDEKTVEGGQRAEGEEPDLQVATARNLDRENLRRPDGKLSQSIALEVFQGGERVLAVDAMADPRFQEQKSVHAGSLRSVLSVPLSLRGSTIGVLYVDNRFTSGAFTREHGAVLEALASQAAVAIQTARLLSNYQKTERALARSKAKVEALNAQLREQLENTEDALSSARAALDAQRHDLARRSDYRQIRGESPQLYRLFSLMDRVRKHDFPVVIHGESGTGKELVARAIHFTGSRKAGPFVAVNCGALPENLLESELFGHVKGAFTGAVAERRGLFELADKGTLLLDEVAEMPLSMQVKLLRVLQTGEITRVGGTRVRTVDVRVLTATHRDLEAMVRESTFREDLLYRIKVVRLRVPPLRERTGDLPLLVEHFLKVNRDSGLGEVQRVTSRALSMMGRYGWPGNVRELETFLKSACLFSDGEELDVVDVIPLLEREDSGVGEHGMGDLLGVSGALGAALRSGSLEQIEELVIERRLEEQEGNKTRTAESLGIDRGTLYNKLRAMKRGL